LRGAPDEPRRPSAVFLDRDGVINRKAPEGEYVTRWSEFAFLPGALDALRALAGAPVRVVVATNQRGVARGRMTAGDLAAIHARMRGAVLEAGGRIDAIYHCPHEAGTCTCRKPAPGLIERARTELADLDLTGAALVGDSESDVEAGRRAGLRTVLLADPGGPRAVATDADHVVPSLLDAARWLVSGAAALS